MNDKELTEAFVRCGASGAAIIPAEAVVLNAEFRAMCEANRCGAYGTCYMCPPDAGSAEELMGRVRSFGRGVLYQRIFFLDDSFDIEGMHRAAKEFHALSYRIQDELRPALGPDALFLTSGGCGLCEVCGRKTCEPCRHPDCAQTSLEACCVDVYQTAKKTELKYVNGTDTVTYFGLVLFSDGQHV